MILITIKRFKHVINAQIESGLACADREEARKSRIVRQEEHQIGKVTADERLTAKRPYHTSLDAVNKTRRSAPILLTLTVKTLPTARMAGVQSVVLSPMSLFSLHSSGFLLSGTARFSHGDNYENPVFTTLGSKARSQPRRDVAAPGRAI